MSKKDVYCAILFLYSCFLYADRRNMVILVDTQEQYDDILQVSNVDNYKIQRATTYTLANALLDGVRPGEQHKSPYFILTTENVWRNIVGFADLYKNFKTLDVATLHAHYCQYPAFNTYEKVELCKNEVMSGENKGFVHIGERCYFIIEYLKKERMWTMEKWGAFCLFVPRYSSADTRDISTRGIHKGKFISDYYNMTLFNSTKGLDSGAALLAVISSLFVKKSENVDITWTLYLNGHGGIDPISIAGLSKEQLRTLLKFFNDSIATDFLWIHTCFFGGSNVLHTYNQFVNNEQLAFLYNFTHLSSTIQLRQTSSTAPHVCLRSDGTFNVQSTMRYGSFFYEIEKMRETKESLVQAIRYVQNAFFEEEIPSIRYPYTPLFFPLDLKEGVPTIFNITRTSAIAHNTDKKAIVIPHGTKSVIFSVYPVFVTEHFYNQPFHFEIIVPIQLPGTVERCVISTPAATRIFVTEIQSAQGFIDFIKCMVSLPQKTERTVYIERLVCMNDISEEQGIFAENKNSPLELHNVVIVINDKDPRFLSVGQQQEYLSGLFFVYNDIQYYSLWKQDSDTELTNNALFAQKKLPGLTIIQPTEPYPQYPFGDPMQLAESYNPVQQLLDNRITTIETVLNNLTRAFEQLTEQLKNK